jgi:YHS domain-containing protein
MEYDINQKSNYSNFGSRVALITSLLILISVFSQAQGKIKPYNHSEKMKTESLGKSHCGDEAGMSCCGSEMVKVSESSAAPWNEVCPILGNKINKKVKTISYDGKVYGFCCEGCDSKFEKEPLKYYKNLSADGKKFIGKKS